MSLILQSTGIQPDTLRSDGYTPDDASFLLRHIGRDALQGARGRDFAKGWRKGKNETTIPTLYRAGSRSLNRCQYVVMTHPQRSAVLVIDVDEPHASGGDCVSISAHVRAALSALIAKNLGPAWVGVNPLSGKCQLLWFIDPVHAAKDRTSPNTRLLAVAVEELNALLGGDKSFSHRFSRWPLHASDDPERYRWHAQHHRIDRLSDLVEVSRSMTGRKPAHNKPAHDQFSSGRERIEAARRAAQQAKDLAALDAELPQTAGPGLIDGVRVLWVRDGRAARDETAFRHALKEAHRMRNAGHRLKDTAIIDAYERAYNVAQAVGADYREPDMPPQRDRLTMARRVRGYVLAGKTNAYPGATERVSQSSQGRKALATMGRKGGQKAAQRWKTDPEGEYAQGRRETLRRTQQRTKVRGKSNRQKVGQFVNEYWMEKDSLPTRSEIMAETQLSRATVTRHLAALRASGELPS